MKMGTTAFENNSTSILIIDDNQDNLLALSALLRNLIPGCCVIKATSGAEGIKKAKAELVDTILLDVQMPIMDGFETCRILKIDTNTKHIPILMVTAIHTDSKSRVKGLELGADAFISKPIDTSELTAQVKAMVRIKKNEDILRKEKDLLEDMVQKRTKELDATIKKYQNLYNSAPDMFISFVAETGKITECNNTFLANVGYSSEEVLGRSIFEMFETVDNDAYEKTAFLSLVQNVGAREVELKLKKRDGTKIDATLNASAVRDDKNGILYINSIWHDITTRKLAAKEREKLHKVVEAKNQDLNSIIYAASHDLRSPLVNIGGFSKILSQYVNKLQELCKKEEPVTEGTLKSLDKLINESIPEAMKYITSGIIKMNTLLDGLLKISKLGTMTLEPRTLDINKIIEMAISALTFQAKENNVNFTVKDLPECLGDETMINQVFSNLLDNAIKYHSTKNGKTEVTVSGYKEEDMCIYVVGDNGIGIDKKHQKKIFELFHRLDPMGDIKGEGLGLTIIKRIVDLHSGKIWVESEPGNGSKFFISLPCRC